MTPSSAHNNTKAMGRFLDYVARLKGDEKGEAQLFLDHLFQAFGHEGTIQAGATPEDRLAKKGKGKRFLDLHWPGRVLFEMKARGEKLERHYDQAFQYWAHLVPNRPPYVILCNFDELWIYDFNAQLYEPMDRVAVLDLPHRSDALKFLLPVAEKPQFKNNLIDATREAAGTMAELFQSIVLRGEARPTAQRFVLQSLVAMFSEDVELLPSGLFRQLCEDCRAGKGSSYDLIGGLFRQMNESKAATGGRFRNVPHFNGGLFSSVEPLELSEKELEILGDASTKNWSKISPAIFGTLFEKSLDAEDGAERHAYGAHYTSEADIQKVVEPTITRPWRHRIREANTLTELKSLRLAMRNFRVLDPACGSGNFLYVAYRELKRLERELIEKVAENFSEREARMKGSEITLDQFYGIDVLPFAVELARVTLILAKEAHCVEQKRQRDQESFEFEQPLPLDNLEKTIVCADALFVDWPEVDAIIGNPPFQSKNKIQQEMGSAYVNRLRKRYPDVPGRADFCVYWFRKAHEHLKPGDRAGLVGTNTIRQNYSRVGGLDHIVSSGGTITEAVSTQVWSGDAVVHVSIVNWVKGESSGKKMLLTQRGDSLESSWERYELDRINAALSPGLDVTAAKDLNVNAKSQACFQGQTHGHEGFLVPSEEAQNLLAKNERALTVLKPYLIGDDMLSAKSGEDPVRRYVIDFHPGTIIEASSYADLFARVKATVLPDRQEAARAEDERSREALADNPRAKVNKHHANFLRYWWHLSYARGELKECLRRIPRYIVCVAVTKRPIFEFVSSAVAPNASLTVFPLADDYSFGILQSSMHWQWFGARCSTLKGDPRYTSNTVFDSFPWPQAPSSEDIARVASAAVSLREFRNAQMKQHNLSLRVNLPRFRGQPMTR